MGQPIIILREGTEETGKRDALKANVNAIIAVSEAIKSTFGPKGMDKMIVESLGDIKITNDGFTILDSIDIENASAKMAIDLSKVQNEKMGDGTTSVVIFTGDLLKRSLELIEQGVHPAIIIKGFTLALQRTLKELKNIAQEITEEDESIFLNAVKTTLNTKSIAGLKDFFGKIILDAVKIIKDEGEIFQKVEDIGIIKERGKSLHESELINGIYIQKEKINVGMPDIIKNAKIAVIKKSLEIKKTEFGAEIQIFKPEDIQKFVDQEDQIMKGYADIFANLGVNLIINENSIDDKVAAYLSKVGIAAIKSVKSSDAKAVAKATGAKKLEKIDDLTEEDLGFAGRIEFSKIGDNEYCYITECKNPKAATLLLRGGLEHSIDEAEIAVKSGIKVLAKLMDTKSFVGGGGAFEMELAKRIRAFAIEAGGKEQIAIQSYAEAIEEIPKTLVRNAGLDEINVIGELSASHSKKGNEFVGIDISDGKIGDIFKKGIIEPTIIKSQIFKGATELAMLILRIDKIISAKKSGGPGGPPPGGMDY
jgi:thermosome